MVGGSLLSEQRLELPRRVERLELRAAADELAVDVDLGESRNKVSHRAKSDKRN